MEKVIGQYILKEKLGENKGKKFYQAVCKIDNQKYSATEIPARSFRSDISSEIDILKTIQKTPYIVSFFEVVKTSSSYYFYYQYCNGGDLSDMIKKQSKIQQQKALQIFKQLFEAFEIINEKKQLVLDIKPQNIYFHNEIVKIGGFKFCKDIGGRGSNSIYKPPQSLSVKMINQQYDLVWTLGVIFYQMIFGFCPFSSSQIDKLMNFGDQSHLNMPQSIVILEQTKLLIGKMLKKNIKQRISWKQLEQLSGKIVEKIKNNKEEKIKTQQIICENQDKQQSIKLTGLMNLFFFKQGDVQINTVEAAQIKIEQPQEESKQQIDQVLIASQKSQEHSNKRLQTKLEISTQDILNHNQQLKQTQKQPLIINTAYKKIRQKVQIIFEGSQIKPKRPENIVIVKDNKLKSTKSKENRKTGIYVNLHKSQKFSSMHYGYMCDICSQCPIIGIRYYCKTCSNFDICQSCFQKNGHQHELQEFPKSKICNHICQILAKLQPKQKKPKIIFQPFKPDPQEQSKLKVEC